ncbi:MAG: 1-deoxy-D-xylulose-5-phosphate reductoisomerase [Alphaproteobacteria bacterium]
MSMKVTVLGSTGSIGKSTIDILSRNLDAYEVVGLTANNNVELLAEQVKNLKPKFAAIANKTKYQDLKEALRGEKVEILAGEDAIEDIAAIDSDWIMASIVGAAGLKPFMKAIKKGRVLALANKETLVCAGDIVMKTVKEKGAKLIPVDSEHSAIFQVLESNNHSKIDRILLTASGGPFREKSLEYMAKVTPAEAVAHPNWSMGAKISVDSATMMNKGLEFIEAYHLFNVPPEKIEIVVHPQSVIHSAVSYVDGSVLAQMGSPDMRTPIAYSLSYPERMTTPSPKLDLTSLAALTFNKPDENLFPCIRIARESLKQGGFAPIVMNAANEEAVASFLAGRIGFLDIALVVEKTLSLSYDNNILNIEDVVAIDKKARYESNNIIKTIS